MNKNEEIRLPPRLSPDAHQAEPVEPDETDRSASEDLLTLPLSPPPLPWPRVFPSL